ncbi:MAG: InlB B-repeat-containing protein, partial [Propionibacteriaceae bacterium]|nr:InlB B-repeat-containing protein [Propionibacteriaceae bacterium]
GATNPNPTTYTVEDTPITLNDATKPGYTFLGWAEGNTIDAGATGDKTFTATWSDAASYDITYVLNGGTNAAGNPMTYTIEDTPVTIADATRDGYTFTGWAEGNQIPAGATGDKTFTATWSDAASYDITYVLNGGTNAATNPMTYTIEDTPVTIADATRDGYTFTGWAEGNEIPAGATGDKTFTAQWKAIVYNITYVLDGGDNNPANPATYTTDSGLITLADPTRDGYTFTGWEPAGTIPAGSMGDKTFTATWKADVVTIVDAKVTSFVKNLQDKNNNNLQFTVVLTLSDGTTQTVTHQESVNGQQKGSKTFTYTSQWGTYNVTAAWNDNNVVTSVTATTGSAAPTTPVAPVKTYTVTFMVDGKVWDTQQVEQGKAATAPPDPTTNSKGQLFNGWDTKFDKVTGDLTVTAKWKGNGNGNQQ